MTNGKPIAKHASEETADAPISEMVPQRKIQHPSLIFWLTFIILVLTLELTLFNLPYWQTFQLEPQQIATQQPLADNEAYNVTFTPPQDIRTLRISTSKSCRIVLNYFDEGSSVNPTQVTHDIYLEVPSTQYIEFHPYGRVNAINLEAVSLLDPHYVTEDVFYALIDDRAIPENTAVTEEGEGAAESTDANTNADADAEANEDANANTGTGEAEATEEEAEAQPPITFSLTVDHPLPLNVSPLRVVVILAVAAIIWCFLPQRRIYRIPLFRTEAQQKHEQLRPLSRIGVIALTTLLCVISLSQLLLTPEKLGSFDSDYSSVSMVEHLNQMRAQRNGYATKGGIQTNGAQEQGSDQPERMQQPYSEESPLAYVYPRYYESQLARLARSFAEGKLYLMDDPYPEFLEMNYPYDAGARTDLMGTDAGYYWDTAYYEGHFYVYFGALPVLVFYLPYFLITGQDLPNAAPVAICLIATLIGLAFLLTQIARRWFPRASIGVMLLCLVLVFLGAQFGWLTLLPRVYEVPVAMALALLVWAAACFVSLDRHPYLAILGSLLVALIFACRPQVGLFGLLLIPFGIQALRRMPTRQARAFYLASALAPIVIVFILLGIYNAARFGNPFDFGANYNLTTNDMRHRPVTLEMAIMSFFSYFIQLPELELQLPFLPPLLSIWPEVAANELRQTWDYAGTIIVEAPIGGILWLSPLVWFMLALRTAPSTPEPADATASGRFSPTTCWRIFTLCAFALVVLVALFDGEGAGILPRYVLDFDIPFLVMGAVGLMLLCTKGKRWPIRIAIVMIVIGLLVLCAIAFHPNVMRSTWDYDMQVLTAQLNYLLFG